MENNLKKDTVSKLKALGIYQIAGGVVGLLLTIWSILNLAAISALLILILLIAVILYSYSVYCGILLVKNKIAGLKHSLINQFLQVINFVISGFAFKYISGVFLTVGIDLTDSFYFLFNIGISSWQISLFDDSEPFLINFNLVALFLILFIEKLKRKIDKEQLENQLAVIGE